MDSDGIYINQALHGYRQGHELLASSIELSSLDKRKMLYLSDASGSEFTDNFDGYLEGYPISSDSYVLSRTWKASEMKRPGCVWTHSLVIDKKNLRQLNSLNCILKYLKRPDSLEDTSSYKVKIRFDSVEVNLANHQISSIFLISSYALNSEKQFIIPTRDRVESEKHVEELWQLLDGEQRYSLSFCCGYLASSQPPKDFFQLAFIPKSGKRFSWDKSTAIYIDSSVKSSVQPNHISEDYAEILAFSLQENGLSKNSILFADELYRLTSHAEVLELMRMTTLLESNPKYAIKFFGPERERFGVTKKISEFELLKVIALDKNLRDLEEIDVLNRLGSLSLDEKVRVFDELLYRGDNQVNRAFIVEFYERLLARENVQLNKLPVWLVVYIVVSGHRTDVSILKSFSSDEILTIVSKSWSENRNATLNFLKDSHNSIGLPSIYSWLLINVDEREFDDVVCTFKIDLQRLPPREMEMLIHKRPLKVISSINLENISEGLAIDLFVSSIEAKKVDMFFDKLNVSYLDKLRWSDDFWFEIISLTAQFDSPPSNKLFVNLYTRVLGLFTKDDTWGKHFKLSAILPFGRFLKRFDAPENLRHALIDLFMSNRISVNELLQCLNSRDEAWEFCSVVNSMKKNSRFKLASSLKSFVGSRQEEDKVHYLLKNIHL